MKSINRILLSSKLLILTRLAHMTITGIPIELGCIIVSYLIYLYTKQNEWLYYGIPMITILHHIDSRKKFYYTPILYFLYMVSVSQTGFTNTLFCTSSLTALAYLCLTNKIPLSTRIYQLNRSFFIATYYSTLILLGLIFLYIMASIFVATQERLKEILSGACIFIFSVILPSLFLTIDKYRKDELVSIPVFIRWAHLICTETLILSGTIYLGYSTLIMAFKSLTPRPYVVYIVVVLILTIEICAKLHDWAPRNWNDLFFQKRNFIYLPLISLGVASLYTEFSLVGFTPRTCTVSLLLLWISVISLSRLTHNHHLTKNERTISLCAFTVMLAIAFALTVM